MHLLAPQSPARPSSTPGFLVGTADASWVVKQISVDDQGLMTSASTDLVGSSLLDHVHVGDVADLQRAAAQALSDHWSSSTLVNLGWPGRWRRASVVVTPMVHDEGTIGFAIHRVGPGDPLSRAMELEQLLMRIAREIEAAHVEVAIPGAAPDVERILGPDALSPRQWDILRRLLQGERVPGIARALYLSPSTVRNHLTAIFAKFSVHSQEELIQLLRAEAGGAPISA